MAGQAGRSKDVIHWEIEDEPIHFEGADEEILHREYLYDPRVCLLEDSFPCAALTDADTGR